MQAEYKGHRFSDEDVIEGDGFIPLGEYNPHNVMPWLIHNEFGTLAVVFAGNPQDALDYAADSGKLDCQRVSQEDYEAMTEDEQEDCMLLGNAGEPFDQSYLGIIGLPNPEAATFVQSFRATYPELVG
jgi:hypothetical protein